MKCKNCGYELVEEERIRVVIVQPGHRRLFYIQENIILKCNNCKKKYIDFNRKDEYIEYVL